MSPTRVAVSSQALPFAVVLLLLVCAELTLASIFFAVVRRQEPFWWLLSGSAIGVGCFLWGAFAYGGRNWDRTTHLEIRDGRVAFVPSRRLRLKGYVTTDAPFPAGGILEYHIETGDHYFTGDHGQFLRASLWVAEANGTKQRLMTDVVGVNLKTTATNLAGAGIPFRVVKVYDSESGEHVESNVKRFT